MRSSNVRDYCEASAPLNEPQRFYHCPFHGPAPGGAFVITKTSKGWLYWCHNCNRRGFVPAGKRTPRELRTILAENKTPVNYTDTTISLPEDFTQEIPQEGLTWLLKYGIMKDIALQLKIGYSPYYHRLILPVFQDGELVYWQGRNLGEVKPGNPKYINVKSTRKDVWFERQIEESDKVVLVEDILSAIKISLGGVSAIALLGTYINPELIDYLYKLGKDTVVWLDPDKKQHSVKLVKRLNQFGVKATCIIDTDKDPKDYTITEIKKKLV